MLRSLLISQQALAEWMGVSRATVSRIERQSGMHLRDLRRIVEAMGGELEVTARFADGEIRLDQWERDLPVAAAERLQSVLSADPKVNDAERRPQQHRGCFAGGILPTFAALAGIGPLLFACSIH